MMTALDPHTQRSLMLGVDHAVPGALSALSVTGGVTVAPQEELLIRFGRNRPEVDICVGEDDVLVSRQHGTVTCRAGRWWVRNTGQSPIRLPHSPVLRAEDEPIPLAVGYTPLFLRGSRGREHLLELHVANLTGLRALPKRRPLTAEERAALAVLGQRYLLHDPLPQPLSRRQAVARLAELQPHAGWTDERVERLITGVCARLRCDEVPDLLRELITSATLVPLDLTLLENPT